MEAKGESQDQGAVVNSYTPPPSRREVLLTRLDANKEHMKHLSERGNSIREDADRFVNEMNQEINVLYRENEYLKKELTREIEGC